MWNESIGFTISTIDEILKRYYDIHVEINGYSGTFEQFKQGKFGAVCYAAAQMDIRAETELTLIFEKMKDFYRIQNALIETNNLNPEGIRDKFSNDLGYQVALGSVSGEFKIAIMYERSEDADANIAELLITECYAFGREMDGDIAKSYQKDGNSQSFTAKWKQGEELEIEYKVDIETVSDNSAPIETPDEIAILFYKLHSDRYTWGNVIQPQRLITESDLPFAASVQVSSRVKVADSETPNDWSTAPRVLNYYKMAIPVLSVNNINITEV